MINIRSVITAIVFLFLAVTLAGCSRQDAGQPAATAANAAPAPGPGKQGDNSMASELAGTAWRLVKIMGMDDSTRTPADRSLYTLEFSADGHASMRADCNQGAGSWSSESPGQLKFGPIAATLAVCEPGSLSDRYLAQFTWVRSYVINEGHLFLATMADGSIIEFEPAPAPETS